MNVLGKAEEDLTPTITKEEALEKATAIAPSAFPLFEEKNWKQRMTGLEELGKAIDALSDDQLSAFSEALIVTLSNKPGWKEPIFQVSVALFGVIGKLARRDMTFSRRSAALVIEGNYI